MKLIVTCSILLIACVCTKAQQLYSFEFDNLSLIEIFEVLEQNTSYNFSYVNDVMPPRKISGTWRSVSVAGLLTELLEDEILGFSIKANDIVIFPLRAPFDPFQLYGRISDKATGELLAGANVYTNAFQGVITDEYGLYSIEIDPVRDSFIVFSYLGYKSERKHINRIVGGRQNISLGAEYNVLEEVTITLETQKQRPAIPNKNALTGETYKIARAISGEQDVNEYINILPGVVKLSEGKSGFSVYGAATDQNLVLIDDAPVFNPNHSLGFISVFNHDALNAVTFHKSAIAAKYGGRLASVLDIRMREGNLNKFNAALTTNPFYSGLTLEGPLVKNKASFLISGRHTHMNYILRQFEAEQGFYVPASIKFYDLHGKLNVVLNKNHRLYFSSFINNDEIDPHKGEGNNLFYDTDWQNRTFTTRWNAIWTDKLFTNISFVYSDYEYQKSTTADTSRLLFNDRSEINNLHVKLESNYHFNKNHKITAGANYTRYRFSPATGSIAVPEQDFTIEYSIDQLKSSELALFVEDNFRISRIANINIGMRYSQFFDIGNDTYEYTYDETGFVLDSTFRPDNDIIRTFDQFEPRVSADIQLHDDWLVQGAWTRTSQYIIRLLNENPTTPNEYWIPAGPQIKPLSSGLLTFGFNWQTTPYAQLYFGVFERKSKNISTFKSGANIFFSESLIDRQITQGDFKSRGFELSLNKIKDEYRYFISYTYTDAKVRFNDINEGAYYNAPENFQHDLNVQGTLALNQRITLGINWQWRSGDLISIPSGIGYIAGFPFELYRERNNFRLPNYNRLDISSNIALVDKATQKLDLSLGVYNLTGSLNPFQSRITADASLPRLEILALTKTTPFIHLKYRLL